jgi:predicted metal-dependent peptidase
LFILQTYLAKLRRQPSTINHQPILNGEHLDVAVLRLYEPTINHQPSNHQPSTINHQPFLPATRELLANAPFFAQLLVRIPKRADDRLSLPFVFVWENQPVLLFQPRLLNLLAAHEDWLAALLCEELLHLLLQHAQQAVQYPVKWAFHLASDIEVRRYLPGRYQDHLYEALSARLHLQTSGFGPGLSTTTSELDEFADLRIIYHALLRLHATVAPTGVLPGWDTDPYARKFHFFWPVIDTPLAWQTWWSPQRALLSELGDTPAGLLLSNRLMGKPQHAQLLWSAILRRFISSGQRSQNRNSLRRPSRRFGTLPGLRRRRTTRLAVVLDTSGSIQPMQRQRFFRELQTLQQYAHEILIIEADHQVRTSYLFSGEIPPFSKGGGSTSFDPALKEINSQGPFDGVIYLTDGEGPLPEVECLSPLLWIICHTSPFSLPPTWPGQIAYWSAT